VVKPLRRAIVLAAGEGTRLRPHTATRPKCLVEVCGRTLLDWQLATLRACGIDDIVVVTGYRGEQIRPAGVRSYENRDYDSTNMVHTLWCAEQELTGEVVVSYSDIVFEPRVLQALLDEPGDLAVAVDLGWERYWRQRFDDPLEDAETLRLDARGCIVDIGRRAQDLSEIEAQYIGLMKFAGEGLERLKAFYARASSRAAAGGNPWSLEGPFAKAYMTDLLQAMIAAGHRIRAVPTQGGWLEIDTTHDYEWARDRFAGGNIHEFFDPNALLAEPDGGF
jgi:choline kinase